MIVYFGLRLGGMCYTFKWDEDTPDKPERLNPRLDLWAHSPSGFEWGYLGSGPAQLALALAADAIGDADRAVQVHQLLKGPMQRGWGRDCWSITRTRLLEMIVDLAKDLPVPWDREIPAEPPVETGGDT
jgi:Family of unknown function (DUF6166)